MQANASTNGFKTAPQRQVGGNLMRALSPTFNDHWSQPRLFLNSLTQPEQQILVNAIRFETSHIQSPTVRQNVVTQLNRISNDLATRVATALGMSAPAPDPTFYHDNTTRGVNIFGVPLPTVATLTVGILATTADPKSLSQAQALQQRLARDGVAASIVAESLSPGVNQTYSQSDASNFDAVFLAQGAESLVSSSVKASSPVKASNSSSGSSSGSSSTLFPLGRPAQILLDGYRYGKLVGAVGPAGGAALEGVGIPQGSTGVLVSSTGIGGAADANAAAADMDAMAADVEAGLRQFRFLDRFPIDAGSALGAPTSAVQKGEAKVASGGVRSATAAGVNGVGVLLAAFFSGVVAL